MSKLKGFLLVLQPNGLTHRVRRHHIFVSIDSLILSFLPRVVLGGRSPPRQSDYYYYRNYNNYNNYY